MGAGKVDCLAVAVPAYFVDSLVAGGVQFLEVFALGVGDIELAADYEGEFLSVGGDVGRCGFLFLEGAAHVVVAGGEGNLGNDVLARCRIQEMYLIVKQIYYRRTVL